MKRWVVYLSTYPPRECGIATFTEDSAQTFDSLYSPREEAKVVALNQNSLSRYRYSKRVIDQIDTSNPEDYRRSARKLNNKKEVLLVHIEHEFGIFGGNLGNNLFGFLEELKKPSVVTFHTVLPNPEPDMLKTVRAISSYVKKIIVMTNLSKEILVKEYGIREDLISIIPHGVHPRSYNSSEKIKKRLGFSNKKIISTFGLLSKGKGIEYGIEAMAEIVKKCPNCIYLVIGATHPVVLSEEGEAYRNSLIELIKKLGLEKNVFFYNKYFDVKRLLEFLEATDLYLSLSLNPNQAVSGTLSYALGMGRPVVSTAFAQAKEFVTPEVGALVEFRDPKALANAAGRIMENDATRELMSKNAYIFTRHMTWPNVVLACMNEYIKIIPELAVKEKNLPVISLKHVEKMTDNFGMFQFAKLDNPDPSSGYTLDDNARAMMATALYYKLYGGLKPLRLISTYLSFLEFVMNKDGVSVNYVNHDRTISEQNLKESLQDARARGFHALSYIIATEKLPVDIRERALRLLKRDTSWNKESLSIRAMAFYIKGFDMLIKAKSLETDKYKKQMSLYANKLVSAYKNESSNEWKWFEDTLTYSNPILPEALLISYNHFQDSEYLKIGKESLDFYIQESFKDGMFVPVGQEGWYKKGNKKVLYDQQPEEVATAITAFRTANKITQDESYIIKMRQAFDWFLGDNVLNQIVYSEASGGCYDGVRQGGVNLNQGAESTLMYLIARLTLQESEHIQSNNRKI